MCHFSDLVTLTLGSTVGAMAAGIPGATVCAFTVGTTLLTKLFLEAINGSPNTMEHITTYANSAEGRKFILCTASPALMGATIGFTISGTVLLASRCFKNICLCTAIGITIVGVTLLVPQK